MPFFQTTYLLAISEEDRLEIEVEVEVEVEVKPLTNAGRPCGKARCERGLTVCQARKLKGKENNKEREGIRMNEWNSKREGGAGGGGGGFKPEVVIDVVVRRRWVLPPERNVHHWLMCFDDVFFQFGGEGGFR